MVAILEIMSVDWPRTSNSDADECIITVSYTHLTLPTIYSV